MALGRLKTALFGGKGVGSASSRPPPFVAASLARIISTQAFRFRRYPERCLIPRPGGLIGEKARGICRAVDLTNPFSAARG